MDGCYIIVTIWNQFAPLLSFFGTHPKRRPKKDAKPSGATGIGLSAVLFLFSSSTLAFPATPSLTGFRPPRLIEVHLIGSVDYAEDTLSKTVPELLEYRAKACGGHSNIALADEKKRKESGLHAPWPIERFECIEPRLALFPCTRERLRVGGRTVKSKGHEQRCSRLSAMLEEELKGFPLVLSRTPAHLC